MNAQLRELLTDLDRDPEELVAELRAAQDRVAASDETLRLDLCRADLRFLRARRQARVYGEQFDHAVATAESAAQGAELRILSAAPAGMPSTLFDLAELAALADRDGRADRLQEIQAAIRDRIDALEELSSGLREEARERFVALQTAEEDQDLETRIALLRANWRLLADLAERFDDRDFRKLSRRVNRRSVTVCSQRVWNAR